MTQSQDERWPQGPPRAYGIQPRQYSKDPSDPAMYLGMILEHGDRKRINNFTELYIKDGIRRFQKFDHPDARDMVKALQQMPAQVMSGLGPNGMIAEEKRIREETKQQKVASIISEMKGKPENEIYHALLPYMGTDDAAKAADDISKSRVPETYPTFRDVQDMARRTPLMKDVEPGARLSPGVLRIKQITDVVEKVEKTERTSRIGNVLHGMYEIPHGAVGWRGTAARWLGSAIGPMHEGFAQRVHDFAQGGEYDRKKIAALDTDLHKYGISLIEYLTGEGGARVSEPEKQMALEKAGQLSGGGDWIDQVGRIESLSRTLIAIDEQIRAERGEDLEFPVATKKEYDASFQKLIRLRYPPEVADSILERLKFGYGG